MRLILSSLLVLLVACAAAAAEEKTSYTGYKFYRIHCQDAETMKHMQDFENEDNGFDIWNSRVKEEGFSCDVVLSPQAQQKYLQIFKSRNVRVEVLSENVQDLIDNQERTRDQSYRSGAPRNILFKFASYGEINNFLYETVEKYPTLARIYTPGQSVEGRNMNVIVITGPAPKDKYIWIDCGIHAREWVTPATCVYTIQALVDGYQANDPIIKPLLDKYEVHIMPSVNPDGYEFTQQTRLWRKNRSKNSGGSCLGVDLNRNFDIKWSQGGTSTSECSDVFHGANGSSEPETKTVIAALTAKQGKWDACITIHSYGAWWLLPYGYSTNPAVNKPANYAQILGVSNTGAAAWTAKYQQKVAVGNSAELLYVTTGSTADYCQDALGIPYSMTLELRPGQGSPDDFYGFTLPEDRLTQVAPETFDAIKVVCDEISKLSP